MRPTATHPNPTPTSTPRRCPRTPTGTTQAMRLVSRNTRRKWHRMAAVRCWTPIHSRRRRRCRTAAVRSITVATIKTTRQRVLIPLTRVSYYCHDTRSRNHPRNTKPHCIYLCTMCVVGLWVFCLRMFVTPLTSVHVGWVGLTLIDMQTDRPRTSVQYRPFRHRFCCMRHLRGCIKCVRRP